MALTCGRLASTSSTPFLPDTEILVIMLPLTLETRGSARRADASRFC